MRCQTEAGAAFGLLWLHRWCGDQVQAEQEAAVPGLVVDVQRIETAAAFKEALRELVTGVA